MANKLKKWVLELEQIRYNLHRSRGFSEAIDLIEKGVLDIELPKRDCLNCSIMGNLLKNLYRLKMETSAKERYYLEKIERLNDKLQITTTTDDEE